MASFIITCLLLFYFYIATSFLSLAVFQVTGSVTAATASPTNSTRHRHKWIGPVGHRVITVDVNGSGEFKSVQAAVDSVPENNRMNVAIQISAGYYM